MESSQDVFKVRIGVNSTSEAGGGNMSFNPATGEIDVNIDRTDGFSLVEKLAHELTHVGQYLRQELDLMANGTGGILHDRTDEIEAYNRQNLFRPVNSQMTSSEITSLVNNRYGGIPRGPVSLNSMSSTAQRTYRSEISIRKSKGLPQRYLVGGCRTF